MKSAEWNDRFDRIDDLCAEIQEAMSEKPGLYRVQGWRKHIERLQAELDALTGNGGEE